MTDILAQRASCPRRWFMRATKRRKLSTTVSTETLAYLEGMVRARKAISMAEAVDLAVGRARQAENRARLERDTAAYFEGRSARVAREEAHLEEALGQMVDEINFDR